DAWEDEVGRIGVFQNRGGAGRKLEVQLIDGIDIEHERLQPSPMQVESWRAAGRRDQSVSVAPVGEVLCNRSERSMMNLGPIDAWAVAAMERDDVAAIGIVA